ncbi:MAG: portal protein [Pikeienuella sp.]
MDGIMNSKAIIDLARKRMAETVEWDRENAKSALDDMENLAGRQWPEDVRSEREAAGKPCPTHNHLTQFVRQVTGDIRKLNPAIKILPGDEAASEETAEIYEGLVRSIEYRSDASSVYERAAESAAQCGIGNFRVLAEYESEKSFNQTLRISSIHNALSVKWDPEARMPTREDANFVFITDMMAREDFAKEYPDKNAIDFEHDGDTDGLEHWREEGNVVVAEYIWREPKKVTLGLLRNGRVVENPPAPLDVVKTRETTLHKVMWSKISGMDVLEGPTELPSKYIPVLAVTGEELHVGSEVVRSSVIRNAKDAQRQYNYAAAAELEVTMLQPKSPYIMTLKQVNGLEKFWNEANRANRPYLPYNPDEKALGPPARQPPPIASQALSAQIERAARDMRATTGIYDAALGDQSNEKSGVAIRQRQIESDISTSIYTDNLQKAIAHCGRVIADMIPRIFDTRRNVRLIATDETERLEAVNVPYLADIRTGEIGIHNNLKAGEYQVRVSVGPSYSTQRQEAAEGMMEFVRAIPQSSTVAGDLIARNLDWPGAEQLADRLASMLPPGVAQNDDMSPEEQQAVSIRQEQERQAQDMQQAGAEAEIRKAIAEASEAESDAEKAQFEVMEQQLEIMAKSGQLNAAIAGIVQQEVARALQGAMQPGFAPQ